MTEYGGPFGGVPGGGGGGWHPQTMSKYLSLKHLLISRTTRISQNAFFMTERFFLSQNAFFMIERFFLSHRTLFLSCSADASFFSAAKLASSLKYLKISPFSWSKLINSKCQTRNLYTLSLMKY